MVAKLDGTNGLLQAYDYQVSTTGFSYTFAAGTTVLVMNPAGTLATGTITMPAAPADGMTISFSSTQAITALTVNANTGQSIVGNPTTLLAGGAASFVYRLASTTWFAQSNTAQLGSAGSPAPVLNVYVSLGTWTKPGTVKAIQVTVVGGGGNGGGTTPTSGSGSGGGGGGAAIRLYPAPSLPGPQPYTVGGAGGTSSFGVAPITVISATGGATGGAGGGGTGNTSAGAGGIGSNGLANIGGGGGMSGSGSSSGAGGGSIYGGGGAGLAGVNAAGNAGQAYGGGGSGGNRISGAGAPAGGAGAAGVIIIEEFY